MQVSSGFYELSFKLLYHNAIVKGTNGMSKLLAQHPPSGDEVSESHKPKLLTWVEQLTLFTHTCRRMTFSADSLPNLETILIIPRATCRHADWICNRASCPILEGARADKMVFHNSRRNYVRRDWETANWPLGVRVFDVWCSTLTLVIDEAEPFGNIDARFQRERFEGSSARGGNGEPDADEVRIIVLSPTPDWLNQIAQRSTCQCDTASIDVLAIHILAPLIQTNTRPITIYMFRPLDPHGDFLEELDEAIFRELRGMYLADDDPKVYSLKTLADYISEGVQDELLPEELKYWREENERRSNKARENHIDDMDQVRGVLSLFRAMTDH
jgi:hypothetical protein